MKRASLLAVAALAGAAMLVLPGCLVIKSQSTTQLNSIGNVRITTTVCASSSVMGSTCTNLGNSIRAATSGDGQALVGYRIPVAAVEPAQILSTDTSVTLTPSPSYAAELQRISPAPAGQKWVGYISQVRTFTGGSFEVTIQPEFSLQRGADGSPFQGPFRYRVVTGLRAAAASAPSTRPVVCANTVTSGTNGLSDVQPPPPASGLPSAYCIDSPTPPEVLTDVLRTTRDLGIIAPAAPVTGQRGQAAVLTFREKTSGSASAALTFAVSATTTLPGATAAPNAINHTFLANQDTPVSVLVNIPPDAAPGTYDVTLKVTSGAGLSLQTRTGVGKLVVLPPTAAGGGGGGGGGAAAVKRISARVRYRVSVGARIRVLSMRALGAPKGAKVVVTCKRGNCSLKRTRTSVGKTVDITGIFTRLVLRPGVTIEVRITKKGFIGRLFQFTFSKTNVRTVECNISLAGRATKCVKV